MTTLFVYGTLLVGEPNHSRLGGCKPLSSAVSEPRYTLVDLGPYPALLQGGNTAIAGELYDVDVALLDELDAFEDPLDFRRLPIALQAGGPAEAYFFVRSSLLKEPRIPRGDWRTRRRP
jgi:gamma-glutamylcyclotransferase (GGCT)/AIG2-like uncharacterized protein YtfP